MVRKSILCLCGVLLASTVSWGFFDGLFPFNPDKKVETYVRENNLEKVTEYLNKKGNKLGKTEQLHYVSVALEDKVCRGEIVKALAETNGSTAHSEYQKGALKHFIYPSGLLYKAAILNCSDAVSAIVRITPEDKVLKTLVGKPDSYRTPKNYQDHIRRIDISKKNYDGFQKTYFEFEKYLDSKFESTKDTKFKEANNTLLRELEQKLSSIERRKKYADYKKSPKGIKNRACELVARIAKQQEYIDHQKEISKVSGVYDKKVLYDAGERIVEYRKELKELKRQYKASSGRELDLSDCK